MRRPNSTRESRIGPVRVAGHLIRLATGAWIYNRAQSRAPVRPALLASDVFATLIARTSDDDAAWRGGAIAFARNALDQGLEVPQDVFAFRKGCERALIRSRRRRGLDPDFTNFETFLLMAERLHAATPAVLAEAASRAEAEWERVLTKPVPALRDWYQASIDSGRKVIAISDTRYSSGELERILRSHGYGQLAKIYSSADHGVSKFTGRLFDVVAESEGVQYHDISHRGDSWVADVLSPAHRGVHGVRVAPPKRPPHAEPLASLALPDTPDSDEPGFRFGFERLGPIMAGFVRMLLAHAYASGVDHLAFVARDGDLPLRAAEILMAGLPPEFRLKLSYIYLSRRSMRGAQGGDGRLTETGERIVRYLEQAGVLDERTALVDIGWRGTIHNQVCDLARKTGKARPRAYYLTLWNEDRIPAPDTPALGLLGDQRRNRGPREGAAWYCALLLEAVARASHGTVTGYEEDPDGAIRPVLAEKGLSRAAEAGAGSAQGIIREGVLAYCREMVSLGTISPPDFERTRTEAQKRLFRLAFFPSRAERDIGRRLVHSESSDDFSATLLQRPGRGLTGRIASLRSPWKGAAFREAGGVLLASTYLIVEASFCYLPLGLKTWLRERLGPPPNDAAAP